MIMKKYIIMVTLFFAPFLSAMQGPNLRQIITENDVNAMLTVVRNNPNVLQQRSAYRNQTLLHWAASLGAEAIVEYLCTQGLDINEPDAEGSTPLDLAVLCDHKLVIRVLLNQNSLELDKAKNAFKMVLQQLNNNEIFKMFLERGFKVDTSEKWDRAQKSGYTGLITRRPGGPKFALKRGNTTS